MISYRKPERKRLPKDIEPPQGELKFHWRRGTVNIFQNQLIRALEKYPEADFKKFIAKILNRLKNTGLSPLQKFALGKMLELTKKRDFGEAEVRWILENSKLFELDLKD